MLVFFERGELETLFGDDYEIICSKSDFSLDTSHGDKHYHGAVEVTVKKKE